ncbi:MAG: helix-turn-helix transcriptional regulator [Chloroflexota bacterium]
MTAHDESGPSQQRPLTPAVFHILLSLAQGDKHGYAIMQEVEQETGGRISLGPGTLSGAIKRLLAEGWIVETGEQPDPALDDGRRRYYRLTDLGRCVAVAEAQRLARLVAQARQRHLLRRISPAGGAPRSARGAGEGQEWRWRGLPTRLTLGT